jgi:hypothetical protein
LNGSQDQRAAEWKARLVEGRVIFGVKGGAAVVEPSRQARDEWVRTIRETSITDLKFWRECTPGYYNSEGEEVFRSHLGEPTAPASTPLTGCCKNGATRAKWRASSASVRAAGLPSVAA